MGQLVNVFSLARWSGFGQVRFDHFSISSKGVLSDKESILDDKFSIIFNISLCPTSVSLIRRQTDFSVFSDNSEKYLSDMLGKFSVLKLDVSGSHMELDTESLLAFLFEDLSGILDFEFCRLILLRREECDAMMHVLKDFINLKYSELLTEEISKSN